MRQLVGEHPPPLSCSRRELAVSGNDVLPHGVGMGVKIARRLPGGVAGVHSLAAQVATKTVFEEGAGGRLDQLPWLVERPIDDGGRFLAFARTSAAVRNYA